MKVRINTLRIGSGEGLFSFVSWENESLVKLLNVLFGIEEGEKIDSISVSTEGIEAKIVEIPH